MARSPFLQLPGLASLWLAVATDAFDFADCGCCRCRKGPLRRKRLLSSSLLLHRSATLPSARSARGGKPPAMRVIMLDRRAGTGIPILVPALRSEEEPFHGFDLAVVVNQRSGQLLGVAANFADGSFRVFAILAVLGGSFLVTHGILLDLKRNGKALLTARLCAAGCGLAACAFALSRGPRATAAGRQRVCPSCRMGRGLPSPYAVEPCARGLPHIRPSSPWPATPSHPTDSMVAARKVSAYRMPGMRLRKRYRTSRSMRVFLRADMVGLLCGKTSTRLPACGFARNAKVWVGKQTRESGWAKCA